MMISSRGIQAQAGFTFMAPAALNAVPSTRTAGLWGPPFLEVVWTIPINYYPT